MENKLDEIVRFLKGLGVQHISKNEKKLLYREYKEKHNLFQLKGELEVLFSINKALISSYGEVSVSNILDLYRKIDSKLFIQLSTIYEGIRIKAKDEVETLRRFKEVVVEILDVTEKVDKEIVEVLDQSLKARLKLKDSLYLTMDSVSEADALLDNCINRSKVFLRQCESRNLEKIVHCLKKDFSMTDKEIVKISKKCASFFVSSNVSKINNLSRCIEEFKEFVKKQNSIMGKASKINDLLDKEFKEVLFDASSIATINPDNLDKTFRFLKGEKLGDLFFCDNQLGDIKGNFTPFQLARIYNESISSLSTSVEKIADVCGSLKDVYKQVFDKDLDMSKLINGNNFASISQLSKDDYKQDKKIKEIFEILSMFVTGEDMENLLRNNFSFLIVPLETVKQSLQNAVLNSNNKDELRRNVLQKIRNHFDMYAGEFQNVQREKSSVYTSSLNKVGIKDIEEEEIKSALEKLKTNPKDIEAWQSRWNKEEKEYRELEVLIALEELDDKILNIESFLNINYVDINQYEEEVMTIMQIFEEIDADYRRIVDENKLNKNLRAIAEKSNHRLENVKVKINNNLLSVINMYQEEIFSFEEQVKQCTKNLGVLEAKDKRYRELDALIKEKNFSDDIVEKRMNLIEKITNFSKEVDKTCRIISKREDEANELLKKIYSVIERENIKKTISGAFNVNTFKEENRNYTLIKYLTFVRCLELEDLVDEAVPKDTRKFIKDMSYKKYRLSLSKEELPLFDRVYFLYKQNMEERQVYKNKISSFMIENGIACENEAFLTSSFYEKITVLAKFSEDLEGELLQYMNAKEENASVNYEELIQKINELIGMKEKFGIQIEEYCEKIEMLRKKQIRR